MTVLAVTCAAAAAAAAAGLGYETEPALDARALATGTREALTALYVGYGSREFAFCLLGRDRLVLAIPDSMVSTDVSVHHRPCRELPSARVSGHSHPGGDGARLCYFSRGDLGHLVEVERDVPFAAVMCGPRTLVWLTREQAARAWRSAGPSALVWPPRDQVVSW